MITIQLLLTLLFLFLGMTVILSLLYSAVRYVPYVPTEWSVIHKMIAAAELKDGQKVIDLGCGDGRLLMASMEDKNVRATGVEINRFISWLARFRIWSRGLKANIVRGNFFKVSLRDTDVVFCYLFPKVMLRLEPKFSEELQNGSRIVSYCFPIKAWRPTKIIQTRSDKPKNFLIYVYHIPYQKVS